MFNPNEIPRNKNKLFSLDCTKEDSKVIIYPVPFDAMSSEKYGSADAPNAILKASHTIDLFDPILEEPWKQGIYMDSINSRIVGINAEIKDLMKDYRELNSKTKEEFEAQSDAYTKFFTLSHKIINLYNEMKSLVSAQIYYTIRNDKISGIVGGDHSVSLGAIQTAADFYKDLVVIQFDAHADLRKGYEGLNSSHASVMHNVIFHTEVKELVQIGIRDLCPLEYEIIKNNDNIHTFFDQVTDYTYNVNNTFHSTLYNLINGKNVWISCDIDGFDPSLCPNTGTPVPGGFTYKEFINILNTIRHYAKIVGFDLVEVGNHKWDAKVGARVLYQLTGYTMKSQNIY